MIKMLLYSKQAQMEHGPKID